MKGTSERALSTAFPSLCEEARNGQSHPENGSHHNLPCWHPGLGLLAFLTVGNKDLWLVSQPASGILSQQSGLTKDVSPSISRGISE